MSRVAPSEGLACVSAPLGWLGVAWTALGVARIAVAEPSSASCVASLRRALPGGALREPPRWIAAHLEALAAHLDGAIVDHAAVRLDERGLSPFRVAVHRAARTLRPGETATYGELACLAGHPGAARAVGRAMATNPFPLVVPCHRILAAGGALGGFSMPGGLETKRRLLALEARPVTEG